MPTTMAKYFLQTEVPEQDFLKTIRTALAEGHQVRFWVSNGQPKLIKDITLKEGDDLEEILKRVDYHWHYATIEESPKKIRRKEFRLWLSFLILPAIVGTLSIWLMPSVANPTATEIMIAKALGVLGAILIFGALGLMQSGKIKGTSAAFAIPYLVGCAVGLISTMWMPNWLTIFLESALVTQTVANLVMNRQKK